MDGLGNFKEVRLNCRRVGSFGFVSKMMIYRLKWIILYTPKITLITMVGRAIIIVFCYARMILLRLTTRAFEVEYSNTCAHSSGL